jgi:hypothetical protein
MAEHFFSEEDKQFISLSLAPSFSPWSLAWMFKIANVPNHHHPTVNIHEVNISFFGCDVASLLATSTTSPADQLFYVGQ